MRTNCFTETLITGTSPDREKFQAWAETVPKYLRNPLHHWTHLEPNRPFGINDRLLNGQTAESIWWHCNQLLAGDGFTARGIMQRMNVAVVGTTDDPVDNLEHHLAMRRKQAAGSDFTCQMRPTWRPDKALAIEDPIAFNAWVDRLGAIADSDIRDFDSFCVALQVRHDAFHAAGCRLSDHGLETIDADDWPEAEIKATFATVRSGKRVAPEAAARYRSCLLHEGPVMDHAAGWVQQFHLDAQRNNNFRLFKALGPDKGFDSIGDRSYAAPLARFLARLDRPDQLAKTILYNLHPKDIEMLATMIGNFQDGTVPGKLQSGPAGGFSTSSTACAASSMPCPAWAGCPALSACSPPRVDSCPTPGTNISAGCGAAFSETKPNAGCCPATSPSSPAWSRTSATAMLPVTSPSVCRPAPAWRSGRGRWPKPLPATGLARACGCG